MFSNCIELDQRTLRRDISPFVGRLFSEGFVCSCILRSMCETTSTFRKWVKQKMQFVFRADLCPGLSTVSVTCGHTSERRPASRNAASCMGLAPWAIPARRGPASQNPAIYMSLAPWDIPARALCVTMSGVLRLGTSLREDPAPQSGLLYVRVLRVTDAHHLHESRALGHPSEEALRHNASHVSLLQCLICEGK